MNYNTSTSGNNTNKETKTGKTNKHPKPTKIKTQTNNAPKWKTSILCKKPMQQPLLWFAFVFVRHCRLCRCCCCFHFVAVINAYTRYSCSFCLIPTLHLFFRLLIFFRAFFPDFFSSFSICSWCFIFFCFFFFFVFLLFFHFFFNNNNNNNIVHL